jgi:DNA-binding NarL/FixJ family response regulator
MAHFNYYTKEKEPVILETELTKEDKIDLSSPIEPESIIDYSKLSDEETIILQLLKENYSQEEIASKLNCSQQNISLKLKEIQQKIK